jgi:tRNA-dihydrouridine synthase B
MSGVTDAPYRRLVKSFGAGLVVSEMIASKEMLYKEKESLKKAGHTVEDAFPRSVQLAGCDPLLMAEAAKLNEDKGAQIIDINYGCPVKKVTKGQLAGSAMMKDVPLATKVLEATVKAVSIPVTLKMRMGWDHHSLNAPELARIAEDLGVQMLTIHGRTRCQFYTGSADWAFVRKVKEAVSIPVIVNGDITTEAKAVEALSLSGADGVMIGRGAYGKPWIIEQVAHFLQTGEKKPSPSLHYDEVLSHYGTETGVRIARKHLGWYSAGLPGSADYRSRIMQTHNPLEAMQHTRSFFGQLIEAGCVPSDATELTDEGCDDSVCDTLLAA